MAKTQQIDYMAVAELGIGGGLGYIGAMVLDQKVLGKQLGNMNPKMRAGIWAAGGLGIAGFCAYKGINRPAAIGAAAGITAYGIVGLLQETGMLARILPGGDVRMNTQSNTSTSESPGYSGVGELVFDDFQEQLPNVTGEDYQDYSTTDNALGAGNEDAALGAGNEDAALGEPLYNPIMGISYNLSQDLYR